MSSTSACVPSAISGSAAPSTLPAGDSFSWSYAARTPGGIFVSFLHPWYISRGLIRAFFALLIYQLRAGTLCYRCFWCIQRSFNKFCLGYKILAIQANLLLLHPSFLCKSLKYTSCTVFRSKFIHYGNDVKTGQKISAIFVCFLPLSLQFASFFFFLPLVLYLYTTDALQRRPCKKMFST